jgi:cytochrome P450
MARVREKCKKLPQSCVAAAIRAGHDAGLCHKAREKLPREDSAMNDAPVMERAAFRFDPYSPAIDADPFPAYKTLRDEYPCFWSEEAGMWVLSRYQDVLNALQDWRTYSSAKETWSTSFPAVPGPRWAAAIRRAMTGCAR